jgi:sec-independent protein translocase protein TatA
MGAGLLQPTHIIFVIVIALLVFGPKRLPEMGRSIGHGIREFKDSIDGTSTPDSTEHHAESVLPDAAPQQPLRVNDLPPAGPPPAAPAATPAASTPVAARSGSSVSR